MLERAKHGDASFTTLTYADDQLPPDGSLDPKHLQGFLKRFRERIRPTKIRFFGVGEYGDDTFRPHFHLALFGFPNCLHGRTDLRVRDCCRVCTTIREAWGKGAIECRELATETAQYLVGYTVKKMTKEEDPRLKGRHPEFARMSLRPGIAAKAMQDLALSLATSEGSRELSRSLDVPRALRHGGTLHPLGRYLRRRLREELGFEEIGGQSALAKQRAQELRALSESVGVAKAVEALKLTPEKQRIRNQAAKFNLRPRKQNL